MADDPQNSRGWIANIKLVRRRRVSLLREIVPPENRQVKCRERNIGRNVDHRRSLWPHRCRGHTWLVYAFLVYDNANHTITVQYALPAALVVILIRHIGVSNTAVTWFVYCIHILHADGM